MAYPGSAEPGLLRPPFNPCFISRFLPVIAFANFKANYTLIFYLVIIYAISNFSFFNYFRLLIRYLYYFDIITLYNQCLQRFCYVMVCLFLIHPIDGISKCFPLHHTKICDFGYKRTAKTKISQRIHDVYTTSNQLRCNVMTLHRR